MRFNENFSAVRNHAPEIADLMMSGIQWLTRMERQGQELDFVQWSRLMRSARRHSDKLSADQLIWLWEAMTSEPRIREKLGERLISIGEMWRKLEPIRVLPAGSRFAIFMKGFRSYGKSVFPLQSHLIPDAEAEILSDLYMKAGKARRLECMEVLTWLEIRPPEIGPKEAEAGSLKVTPEDVEIIDGLLRVRVDSLNIAFTRTRLRLDPHRRSHSGRAYDHVALIEENGYLPLEKVRLKNEKVLWEKLVSGCKKGSDQIKLF